MELAVRLLAIPLSWSRDGIKRSHSLREFNGRCVHYRLCCIACASHLFLAFFSFFSSFSDRERNLLCLRLEFVEFAKIIFAEVVDDAFAIVSENRGGVAIDLRLKLGKTKERERERERNEI